MPKADDVKTLVHKYIDEQFDAMSDVDLENLTGGGGEVPVEGPSPEFEKWLALNPDLVQTLKNRFAGLRLGGAIRD